jgi:hypothetical protein
MKSSYYEAPDNGTFSFLLLCPLLGP